MLGFGAQGEVLDVSPVVQGLTELKAGDYPAPGQVDAIAQLLVHGLEMAAGLRKGTTLLKKLWTAESGPVWTLPSRVDTISFSGGVADCIDINHTPGKFGDMGVELGQAIRKSLLCREEYVLGKETVRATVIGAGCHSAQLSGSTVFVRGVQLPVKNLPVAVFSAQEQLSQTLDSLIADRLTQFDSDAVVLAMPGGGGYDRISMLAQMILRGIGSRQALICLEADMAKALGQKIGLLAPEKPCLCIDRVRLTEGSFLDVGSPVGPALPVVVKTLVLER